MAKITTQIPSISNIGVQSVTGDGVDNTDPKNPIIVATNPKDLPEDLYIATLIDSSSLLYESDGIYKYIDLQPFSTITISNTNEIVRKGNDIFIAGNFTFDNTGQAFIARLSGCYLDSNGDLKFAESDFQTISTAVHSLLFHNDFLFLTSRTTQTIILKINPYDLSDIRSLILPNDATYGGETTDILGYKDKLYVLVTTGYQQTSKFVEIADNLVQYRQVFNIPNVAGYFTAGSLPFLIYNDEIYTTFIVNATQVAVRVYDLQGNMVRQRTGITINSNLSGASPVAAPHWIGIFNNKLLITYLYGKSLLRLDCATLATEESIALTTSITDDNTIDNQGYVYLNGEINPFDTGVLPKLLKIKYNNFTDYTVLLEGNSYNNNKGSYGSIGTYPIKESLNNRNKTSIVGLSSTKAEYNTSLSDGDFLFSGDVVNTPDASTTVKGKIKLAGDLGGTADLPTTPTAVHKIGDTFINSTNFDPIISQDTNGKIIKIREINPESSTLPTSYTDIYCWGDSFFGGAGGATKIPDQLALVTKFNVINKGVGGETSTQIKNRFLAEPLNFDKSVIIWAGRNNFNDPTTVKADIATMIANLSHTRYLVVSIFNGDSASEWVGGSDYNIIKQLNADLKVLYGKKYIEARDYIVALHNESAQDLIDFSHDVAPTSLRNVGDPLHLNTLGNSLVADLLNQHLGTLFAREGYFQSKDFKGYFERNLPLHTYGDEIFTGQKTVTNTGATRLNGLTFTNNGTGSTNSSALFTNLNTGVGAQFDNRLSGYGIYGSNVSASSGRIVYITNVSTVGGYGLYSSVSGSNATGIFSSTSSAATATFSASSSSGIANFAQGSDTGVVSVINSTSTGTGDALQIRKNNATISKFDQNGILTTPSPIFTGTATASSITASQTVEGQNLRVSFGGLDFTTDTSYGTANIPVILRKTGKLKFRSSITASNGIIFDGDAITVDRTIGWQDKDITVAGLSDILAGVSNINTSAGTLTLATTGTFVSYYIFEGTTATWTLPVPAGNTSKKLALINTGTGTVTVNTNAGANVLYNSGSITNTYPLLMGSTVELYSNGTKWIVL